MRANERLLLVHAEGAGRLLVSVSDESGGRVVGCSSVWDSALHSLTSKLPTEAAGAAPIFSGPGGHTYTFTVEPMSAASTANGTRANGHADGHEPTAQMNGHGGQSARAANGRAAAPPSRQKAVAVRFTIETEHNETELLYEPPPPALRIPGLELGGQPVAAASPKPAAAAHSPYPHAGPSAEAWESQQRQAHTERLLAATRSNWNTPSPAPRANGHAHHGQPLQRAYDSPGVAEQWWSR